MVTWLWGLKEVCRPVARCSIFRYSPGDTAENYIKPRLWKPVTQPRFEAECNYTSYSLSKSNCVPYHANIAHWGRGGTAPLFLNLGTGQQQAPAPFNPREDPRAQCRRLGGPQSRLNEEGTGKILRRGWNPGRPVRSCTDWATHSLSKLCLISSAFSQDCPQLLETLVCVLLVAYLGSSLTDKYYRFLAFLETNYVLLQPYVS
jgi:hypothetical protein